MIFFLSVQKNMFLKRERPETNDFVIKKYLVVKEKYFNISRNLNFVQLLADTLAKSF